VSDPEFARVRQRITATVIDFVLVFGASAVGLLFVPNGIAVATGDLPPEAAPYWLPLVAAIPSIGFPAYGSLLVLLTRGRTPGMALAGIRVAGPYGEGPTRARLAWRGVIVVGFAWLALAGMAAGRLLVDPLTGLLELTGRVPVPVLRESLLTAVFVLSLQLVLAPVALWLTALLWARFDERGRTWQDIAAGTTVVAR